MLLAMDTATRTASVALFSERGLVGEITWWAHENHTVELMPQVERLLRLAGAALDQVRVIGVVTGPGSFTGLRIGLSLAKGLALGRGLDLVGVPTLDVAAHAYAQQPRPLWVVLQAGRGRYAAASYRTADGRAVRDSDYVVGDAAGLAAVIDERRGPSSWFVGGELDAALRAALAARLGDRVVAAEPAAATRRAGYLAELAWRRWQAHESSDLDSLVPFYIPTASLPQAMAT